MPHEKALKRRRPVEVITTDGLPSYPAAMEELGKTERGEMGRGLYKRAGNFTYHSGDENE